VKTLTQIFSETASYRQKHEKILATNKHERIRTNIKIPNRLIFFLFRVWRVFVRG